MRRAAIQYGVPLTTLRDRVDGRVSENCTRTGPQTLFTHEEEKQFVDHIEEMALLGYGYTRTEILNLATDYAVHLKKRKPTDNRLSENWMAGFLKI